MNERTITQFRVKQEKQNFQFITIKCKSCVCRAMLTFDVCEMAEPTVAYWSNLEFIAGIFSWNRCFQYLSSDLIFNFLSFHFQTALVIWYYRGALHFQKSQAACLKLYNQAFEPSWYSYIPFGLCELRKGSDKAAVGRGISPCHFAPLGFYLKESYVSASSLTKSYNLDTWQFKHTPAPVKLHEKQMRNKMDCYYYSILNLFLSDIQMDILQAVLFFFILFF